MFAGQPWHGLEPYVDETEPESEDPKWNPIKPLVPSPDPVAVYAYWVAYKSRTVPSFERAWQPRYLPLFNAAVALAEIGVVRQIEQGVDTPESTSPRTVGKSPRDYDELALWLYSGIIGASGAAASIIIRGAKGGAFQTAQKYGWGTRGRGPFWSVSVDTAGQLAQGYVAKGMEIVKEDRFGFGRNARNQNAWADPGLG